MTQPSYWDKTASATTNVAIVGGGLLGCCIAQFLQRQMPHCSIVIVERNEGGYGASTRNAGFACFGSVGEIAADIDTLGPQTAYEIVRQRVEGLRLLLSIVHPQAVEYEQCGGHEIFTADDPALHRIDEVNSLLRDLFPTLPFVRDDNRASFLGLSDSVRHVIRTPYEGALHSGKLRKHLLCVPQITGTVVAIEQCNDGWELLIQKHENDKCFHHLKSSLVVVCTNAWMNELIPSANITPARGQILITKPIEGLALHGTVHMNKGYVYFRNVGNRVLLGGARNLAIAEETTTEMNVTQTIQNYLEDLLYSIILPQFSKERSQSIVDMRWAGIMAFSPDKKPFVHQVKPHLWSAFTCNGMGVALAASVANRVVAEMSTEL